MPLFYQHNINENEKLGVWKIEEAEPFFLAKVPLQRNISHPHKRLQHLAGRYLLQELFIDFPYELIEIADTRKPYLRNEAYHFSISHCGNYAAALVSRVNRVGVDIEEVTPSIHKIMHKFLSEEEQLLLGLDLTIVRQVEENAGKEKLPEQWLDNLKAQTQDPKWLLERISAGRPVSDHTTVKQPQVTAMLNIGNMQKLHIPVGNLFLLTVVWSAKEAIYKWWGNGSMDFKKHMQLKEPLMMNQSDWIKSQFRLNKEKPVDLPLQSRFFDQLVLTWLIY